jgi:signal transduction histidine kinase
MRMQEPGFHCTLTEHPDPLLPLASIVPQDISRVLVNLLNNAFYAVAQRKKTAGEGFKPEVILTTRTAGQQVEVTVRDNGGGIDNAIIDRIFHPFFTTKPAGAGTGLGLSISYDIVTKGHGGTFRVDTRPGDYTEFIVSLPISPTP